MDGAGRAGCQPVAHSGTTGNRGASSRAGGSVVESGHSQPGRTLPAPARKLADRHRLSPAAVGLVVDARSGSPCVMANRDLISCIRAPVNKRDREICLASIGHSPTSHCPSSRTDGGTTDPRFLTPSSRHGLFPLCRKIDLAPPGGRSDRKDRRSHRASRDERAKKIRSAESGSGRRAGIRF
jgi:hypothetical protein